MADGGEVIFKFLGDDSKLKGVLGGITGALKTTMKLAAASTAAVATGFGVLLKESVEARGELEQLEGGVNKLFGESSQKVMENAR